MLHDEYETQNGFRASDNGEKSNVKSNHPTRIQYKTVPDLNYSNSMTNSDGEMSTCTAFITEFTQRNNLQRNFSQDYLSASTLWNHFHNAGEIIDVVRSENSNFGIIMKETENGSSSPRGSNGRNITRYIVEGDGLQFVCLKCPFGFA
jgi:hypothetical protein